MAVFTSCHFIMEGPGAGFTVHQFLSAFIQRIETNQEQSNSQSLFQSSGTNKSHMNCLRDNRYVRTWKGLTSFNLCNKPDWAVGMGQLYVWQVMIRSNEFDRCHHYLRMHCSFATLIRVRHISMLWNIAVKYYSSAYTYLSMIICALYSHCTAVLEKHSVNCAGTALLHATQHTPQHFSVKKSSHLVTLTHNQGCSTRSLVMQIFLWTFTAKPHNRIVVHQASQGIDAALQITGWCTRPLYMSKNPIRYMISFCKTAPVLCGPNGPPNTFFIIPACTLSYNIICFPWSVPCVLPFSRDDIPWKFDVVGTHVVNLYLKMWVDN